MKEVTELANHMKTYFKIKFDQNGVKFLEDFIEQNKSEIPEEEWDGFIFSCGAFLGQTIIENFGGYWEKEENGVIAVAFDDKNKVYPFEKARKQFENGLEDSISTLYKIIPTVFKIQPKSKKPWWKFWMK